MFDKRWVAAILMLVVLPGCNIEVAGMRSPLGHDYDAISWQPLNQPLDQEVRIAPGYTAAVANDARSDQASLQRRLAELPEDILASPLIRITIGLRPPGELESPEPGPTVEILGPFPAKGEIDAESGQVVARYSARELPRDGDQVVIADPPLLESGVRIIIRLIPADGSETRWEYALTPNRKPYGGTVASIGDAPQRGSLVFSTVFEQDTDFRRALNQTWDRIRDHALGDVIFMVFWIGGLALVLGVGVWRWRAVEGD